MWIATCLTDRLLNAPLGPRARENRYIGSGGAGLRWTDVADFPFTLGVISDEISQDLDVVIRTAKDFKLDAVELRSIFDVKVQDLERDHLQRLKEGLGEADLRVISIASPFLKCEIDDDKEYFEHIGIFERCIEIARELDTDLVRGFTFWRRDGLDGLPKYWDQIVEKFQKPTEIAERENVVLEIENEQSCFVGTGEDLARFLREVDSKNVKAIWDPGNAYYDDAREEAFPVGYEALKPWIVHVHLKDVVINQEGKPECVPIGTGEVDIEGQLRALKADGYTGCVSLETHWRPKALDEELLQRPGGEEFSSSGEYASRVCLENIWRMLRELDRPPGCQ
jgi:sugar phosphate isomerase/epimerase